MPIDLPTLVLLLLAAFTAGTVDAVVGGGGLIQLPTLLLGLPRTIPVAMVSGTNKLTSIAGTAMATGTYLRSVKVALVPAAVLMSCAAMGSALGARLVHYLPRDLFTPLLFVVLVGMGWYTHRRPALGMASAPRVRGRRRLLALAGIGLAVGIYDGFLGPGTGTFFIVAFVTWLGMGFLEASAYAKVANLATNAGAIAVFAAHGQIIWLLGGLMAAANLTGGFLGATLAVRHGNGFVRRVFLVVVGVLAVKMGVESLLLWQRALGS